MAAWGNALGGWRRQKRVAGRFSVSNAPSVRSREKKKAAKQKYKAARKANAAGHRARTKGSVKARARETVKAGVGIKGRGRKTAVGIGQIAAGKALSSHTLAARGRNNVKGGVIESAVRTNQTRNWSKGLQKSRNAQAKAQYRKEIGSTSKSRAKKIAAATGIVAGAAAFAYANGNITAEGKRTGDGGFLAGVGVNNKGVFNEPRVHRSVNLGVFGNVNQGHYQARARTGGGREGRLVVTPGVVQARSGNKTATYRRRRQ